MPCFEVLSGGVLKSLELFPFWCRRSSKACFRHGLKCQKTIRGIILIPSGTYRALAGQSPVSAFEAHLIQRYTRPYTSAVEQRVAARDNVCEGMRKDVEDDG